MNNKMLNTTKLLGVTALLASSVNVLAEQYTVTAEVKNTFDISEVTPFTVGKLRAVADATASSTDVSSLILSAEDGTVQSGGTVGTLSSIGQLEVGTPGEIKVINLAGFAVLKIKAIPATTLKLDPHPPGAAFFNVKDFTYFITSGNNDQKPYVAGTTELTADSTGVASFKIGATVETTAGADATQPYQDAPYKGSYTIEVEY